MATERIDISTASAAMLASIIDAAADVDIREAAAKDAASKSQEAMDFYSKRVVLAMRQVGATEQAEKIERFFAGEAEGSFELAINQIDWVVECEFKEKEA